MNERTPHPKKLSIEAAKKLQSRQIELPDAESLRAASTYQEGEDYPNEELARTKAERFAILAHLAREVTKVTLTGNGRETRFYQPIQVSPDSMRFTNNSAQINQLENDLLDDEDFKYAGNEVLRLPENRAAVLRFNEIATGIAEHSDGSFYSKGDTIENRLGGITYDVIVGTCSLMKIILNHIRKERPQLNAQEIREIILDNIDFLEEIATKNLAHSEKLIHGTEQTEEGIEEFDTDILDYADTILKVEGGSYKLVLLNQNPKPKLGLYGATLGCPANYHLDEGDTVIRQMVTAVINTAHDRGIFKELKTLKIPPFDII